MESHRNHSKSHKISGKLETSPGNKFGEIDTLNAYLLTPQTYPFFWFWPFWHPKRVTRVTRHYRQKVPFLRVFLVARVYSHIVEWPPPPGPWAYRGSTHWGAPSGKVCVVTRVASFLVWGGGGQDPQMYRQKMYIYCYLYYYKNQGCVFVCVSCLYRPPSHWWISFIFYTIIGLDPEGGQWLLKFKSNHNKKFNRQNAKQYMWDCSKKWNRKHTNSDTVVGFENKMVSVHSAVPVTTQDTDIPRWRFFFPHARVSAESHAHARHARHSRVFTPEFGDSLTSRQLLQLRAHTLMCFVGLFPLIKFPQTHSRTRQCNLQVLASRVYGNATCKFELPKLGKIYKLSKFVLRGY